MRIHAKLEIPNIDELMKDCGLDEYGEVQKYIDNFIIEKSEPYMPKKDDILIESASIGSRGGLVIWDTPYAQYLYEGKLMVSPTTGSSWAKFGEEKVLASPSVDLHYHSGDSNRREKWFDRMIDNEMDNLIEGIQNIVNGGKL